MNKFFFFSQRLTDTSISSVASSSPHLPVIYAAAVAASCLELKDRLNGNLWDWTDWLCTVLGGSIAALLFYVLFPMVWS